MHWESGSRRMSWDFKDCVMHDHQHAVEQALNRVPAAISLGAIEGSDALLTSTPIALLFFAEVTLTVATARKKGHALAQSAP